MKRDERDTTRRKRWNINQIEKNIIKMDHYKVSQLLINSIVSKLVAKNGSK